MVIDAIIQLDAAVWSLWRCPKALPKILNSRFVNTVHEQVVHIGCKQLEKSERMARTRMSLQDCWWGGRGGCLSSVALNPPRSGTWDGIYHFIQKK
jgi:hypothetical protein